MTKWMKHLQKKTMRMKKQGKRISDFFGKDEMSDDT